jgi:hypothetical protein
MKLLAGAIPVIRLLGIVGLSAAAAALYRPSKGIGLVVSALDSRPGDPGSSLGVAHENQCVTSLDKMFTCSVPSVGTVCSINCDCVLHWPNAPSAVRGW